jgi:2-aminoadipate transaminase
MLENLDQKLSKNMVVAKRSPIREILKLTQRPEIISFAGGLPAENSFPVADIKECVDEILAELGTKALQYGTTEGYYDLRKELVKHYKKQGIDITINNIMITTASQQGLDLTGKIFINPDDTVICGLPSYLGGLLAFRSYGCEIVGIKFDKDGMIVEELENTLSDLKSKNKLPKFIYLIPDFQNPTGLTYPELRRKEIIDVADRYDLLIIEDRPYRELRFDGEEQKMMFNSTKMDELLC